MNILKKYNIVAVILIVCVLKLTNVSNAQDSVNIYISQLNQLNIEQLITKSNLEVSISQQIALYYLLGKQYFKLNDFTKSYNSFDNITANYNHNISKKFAYRINVNKGLTLGKQYKYAEATEILLLSYKYIQQTTDTLETGKLLYDIGETHFNWGKNDKAGKYFQEAEVIFRKYEQYEMLSSTYMKLGAIAQKLDLNKMAISYYLSSKEITQINKPNKSYINSLINLGKTYIVTNNYSEASNLLREALKHSEDINYIEGKIYALNNISELFVAKNDNENALRFLNKAKILLKEIDNSEIRILVMSNIATVYKLLKKHKKALTCFQKVYDLQKTSYNKVFTHNTLLQIAELHKLTKNYKLAHQYLDSCQIVSEQIGSKQTLFYAKLQRAELFLLQNNTEQANKILIKLLNKMEQEQYLEIKLGIYLRLSDLYKIRNEYEKSLFYFQKYQELLMNKLEKAYTFQLGKIQNDSKLQSLTDKLTIAKYQNTVKQKEINYRKRITFFIGSISVLLILFSLILLKLYIDKTKALKHLVKKNLELVKQIPFSTEKEQINNYVKEEDNNKSKELVKLLIEKIEIEEIYLQNKITVTDVAKKLDTNRTYLSAAISSVLDTNFNNLINKYRIEKARIMLSQTEQKLTIEGIANNVGFNSKSAFNIAFKKFTGVTPSALRKQAYQNK